VIEALQVYEAGSAEDVFLSAPELPLEPEPEPVIAAAVTTAEGIYTPAEKRMSLRELIASQQK
jgi:hypothetical protein